MEIREIQKEHEQKYDELALSRGSIFHTARWTSMFGQGLRRYGFFDKGGELIGGFFTYEEKKFWLRLCHNPPFTPSTGPILNISAKNPVAIMNLWKKAVSLMAEYLDSLSYSVISFRLDRKIVDMQPFIWRKFKVVPIYTYVLDLTLLMDALWERMSNERRNDVRKAIKDGFRAERTRDLKVVKSLVLKTFERQNKKTIINEYYLSKILNEFSTDDNSFAFVSYLDEKPVAFAYCVHDRNTAFYLLGGHDSEKSHRGAGALALWECIRRAADLKLKYFDFEGSMIPQIERYFRGFGGELVPFYCVNKAPLPVEMILKCFKREMF